MSKQAWKLALFTSVIIVALSGCSGCSPKNNHGGKFVDITGSNTVTPLSTLFAEAFMDENPGVNIAVAGPGSGAGIAALINGTADICQSSRPIKQSEIEQAAARGVDVVETKIASDIIAVVVHPLNPVSEITVKQLSGIYTGEIKNWSQLGGPDAPIVALARDTSSGTHSVFKEIIIQMSGLPEENKTLEYSGTVRFLPSTTIGITQVSRNQNAIFYAGLGYITDSIKPLAIKKSANSLAVFPSVQEASGKSYPLSRNLYYYTAGEPAGAVKAFIDFSLSPEGQELVLSAGFAPVVQ